MEINGLEKDMEKMFALNTERMEKFKRAEAVIDPTDPIKELSCNLHPPMLKLKIIAVRQETERVKTYRFVSADSKKILPRFRAGQYICLKTVIGNTFVSRPYSISSNPDQSVNYYEITICKKDDGYVSGYIINHWVPGFEVKATGPHGCFYHEPLRDKKHIVALAGGSGITPFRSMILEMANKKQPSKIVLIYGSRNEKEIVFKEELEQFAHNYPNRLQIVHVLSEPFPEWKGYRGLISGELIEKIVNDLNHYSFFLCGPPEMYNYCIGNLEKLGVPKRSIRVELSSAYHDLSAYFGFPKADDDKYYLISYRKRNSDGEIKALHGETILTAFERAGLNPDSQCRTGECGFCRSLLLTGEVYIKKDGDGRRAADLEYGFIHPCSTYPMSDLQMIIN
jgi:glycine betaine catabolism B